MYCCFKELKPANWRAIVGVVLLTIVPGDERSVTGFGAVSNILRIWGGRLGFQV